MASNGVEVASKWRRMASNGVEVSSNGVEVSSNGVEWRWMSSNGVEVSSNGVEWRRSVPSSSANCCWKLDPGAAAKPGKEELRCYRRRTAVCRPAASSAAGGCASPPQERWSTVRRLVASSWGAQVLQESRWPGSPAPALRCLSQRGPICGESKKENMRRGQQEYLNKIKKMKRMMSSIVSVLFASFHPVQEGSLRGAPHSLLPGFFL